MNLALDTHVLLWWLDDNPLLGDGAREAIANPGNLVIVSAAVIWEIRIKQALGKIDIDASFPDILRSQGFESMPVTQAHAWAVGELPMHHRDPFDRMMIAQARVEGLAVVTHDPVFRRYEVSLLES